MALPQPEAPPPSARPTGHVALIGMMAVGKSTVGRGLARRWGVRFIDTDTEIEATTGQTVRELWEEGGEPGYRPLERRAVQAALATSEPVVLATPGGVVVDDLMAEALAGEDVTTVYLRATAATLVDHVGDGEGHRPLLGDDPPAAIAGLLRQRAGRYQALADLVVDVDGREPDEVVAAVLAGLST